LLLQIAVNYTDHLNDLSDTNTTIAISQQVIDNAQNDLDKNGLLDEIFIQLILIHLKINLIKFKSISAQKSVKLVELVDPD